MGFSSRICCTMLLALSAVFLTDARGLDDVPTVTSRSLLSDGQDANGCPAYDKYTFYSQKDRYGGDIDNPRVNLPVSLDAAFDACNAVHDPPCVAFNSDFNYKSGVSAAAIIPANYYRTKCQGLYLKDEYSSLATGETKVLVVPTPKMLGCYNDYVVPEDQLTGDNPNWYKDGESSRDFTASRAFSYVRPSDILSVAACNEIAVMNKASYFGLEKGTECWWSKPGANLEKQIEQFGPAKEGECNTKCAGDKSTMCGGSSYFNLYTAVNTV